jgi:hypothetical protein
VEEYYTLLSFSLFLKKDYRKKKLVQQLLCLVIATFRVITNDVSEDKSGSSSLGKTASSDYSNIVYKIRK